MARRSRPAPWRRRPQHSWWPHPAGSDRSARGGRARGGVSPGGTLLLLFGLLLPFVLVGGANALTGAWFAGRSAPGDSGVPRGLGATGRVPERQEPGVRLLRDSAELRDPRSEEAVDVPDGPLGVPEPVLRAYRGAARGVAGTDPSCGLHWSVLAAIGRAESGHARSGRVDGTGTTATAILGPRLDGGEDLAAVPDTDSGELDGDPVWDRAVGPMQFLPSTWKRYGADGDGDGVTSPHNVHDAALAAARYLCDSGGELNRPRELARAVFRYNHSESYVREVLGWATAYRTGVLPVPTNPAPEVDEVVLPEAGSSSPEPSERTEPERSGQRPEFPPLSPAPGPSGDSGRESFSPLVPAPSRGGGAEEPAGAERPSRTRAPETSDGGGAEPAEPSRTSREPAPASEPSAESHPSTPSGSEREAVSSIPESSPEAATGP